MIKKISAASMGKGDQSWLKTHFHFSFADYYNPKNINFGVLRVLNDDFVTAHRGFATHFHSDMEIITYVVKGELTHADNLGYNSTIGKGHIQYISAGTGISHSEHNKTSETIRLLQAWIIPDRRGHKPAYGDYRFVWEERENKWLHMVSGKNGVAPVKINQDANFYSLSLDAGKKIEVIIGLRRQGYLVQIEGSSKVSSEWLEQHDALELVEQSITITARQKSHFLLIEMNK